MATKIVEEQRTAPVKSPNAVMVAECKMLCVELWPDEYGHLASEVAAELKAAKSAARCARLASSLDEKRVPVGPAHEPQPRARPALQLIHGGLA